MASSDCLFNRGCLVVKTSLEEAFLNDGTYKTGHG